MPLAGVDHRLRPHLAHRALDGLVVVAHDPGRRAGQGGQHRLPLDCVRAAAHEHPPGHRSPAPRRIADGGQQVELAAPRAHLPAPHRLRHRDRERPAVEHDRVGPRRWRGERIEDHLAEGAEVVAGELRVRAGRDVAPRADGGPARLPPNPPARPAQAGPGPDPPPGRGPPRGSRRRVHALSAAPRGGRARARSSGTPGACRAHAAARAARRTCAARHRSRGARAACASSGRSSGRTGSGAARTPCPSRRSRRATRRQRAPSGTEGGWRECAVEASEDAIVRCPCVRLYGTNGVGNPHRPRQGDRLGQLLSRGG